MIHLDNVSLLIQGFAVRQIISAMSQCWDNRPPFLRWDTLKRAQGLAKTPLTTRITGSSGLALTLDFLRKEFWICVNIDPDNEF